MQVSIKVATLNFTGINNSPFEYHDGSEERLQLDKIFIELLKHQPEFNDNDFAWNLGKIDSIMQKERYSPAYKPEAGVLRGKLVNKEEFDLLWDHYYEMSEDKVAKTNPSEVNISRCKLFDWLVYLSLLTHIFGEVELDKIKEKDTKIFQQKLKEWHSKAYLKVIPKIDKVVSYILKESLSVLFLQEAGSENWEKHIPAGYYCKKRQQSLIIYSSNFTDQPSSPFTDKYHELLNFNKDSVYVKSKDHLFISAHLTSKSANVEQAEQMYEVLNRILTEYPNLKIVVGMDANHFLKARDSFHTFPAEAKDITTRKKRSYFQPQFNKANKLVEEVKDLLLSNLPIKQGKVETIEHKAGNQELLPNDNHPFDHLIVKGKMNIAVADERSKSIGLRKSRNLNELSNSGQIKQTPTKQG